MEMQYEELKVNQEVAQRTRLPSSLTDTLSRTSTSEGRTDASMLPSDLHMPHIPNKMNTRRNSFLKNSSSTYNWMNTATLIHVWALRRKLWRSKLPREGVCSSLRPFNSYTAHLQWQQCLPSKPPTMRWSRSQAPSQQTSCSKIKSGINIKWKHYSFCFPMRRWITSCTLIPTEKNNFGVSSLPPPSKHSAHPRHAPQNR